VVEHKPHHTKVEVQVQVAAGTEGKKMLTNIEKCNVVLFQHITSPGARGYGLDLFNVGVTFEMREPNTEKSIFRFIMIVGSQHLLNGRVKGKVAERQRERGE